MIYTSPMIEDIIKSPSAKKALSQISPIYGESFVGLWLFEVIGRQLDDLNRWGEEFGDQVVPYTATWSLPYWEEQFGIKTEKSLTMEQRRNAVLARIQTRAPINPEKLGKIASLAAGVEVKIEEQPGSFRFLVTMTDIQGAYNKKALKAEIDLRKPAHLIYDILIRLIAAFRNENQASLAEFRVQADAQNWFLDVIFLDGEQVLDGGWKLDQILQGGFLLGHLKMEDAFRNQNRCSAAVASIAPTVRNQTRFALQGLKFSAGTRFYPLDRYRFDGKRRFDGSFRMNGGESGTYFKLERLAFAFRARSQSSRSCCVKVQGTAVKYAQPLPAAAQKVCLSTADQTRISPERMRFSAGVTNKNEIPVTLTKDSWWMVDGSYAIDGQKRFNAAVIKEEF